MAQEEERALDGTGKPAVVPAPPAAEGSEPVAPPPPEPQQAAPAAPVEEMIPLPEEESGREAPAEAPAEAAAVPDEPMLVRQVMQRLITLMGVRAKVELEKKPDGTYYANIRARHSPGLLIGHRGDTLRALQYLVRTIVRQQYPDAPVISVDVGGYRARRENFLCKKATAVARIVLETGREMSLDTITEKEMEAVQLTLREIPGVRVYALGTGPRRNVIIAPIADRKDEARGRRPADTGYGPEV